MKALVKAKPEAGLSYEDVPVPAIGRADVLIKVLRTGICGTDLHIYSWDPGPRRTYLSLSSSATSSSARSSSSAWMSTTLESVTS